MKIFVDEGDDGFGTGGSTRQFCNPTKRGGVFPKITSSQPEVVSRVEGHLTLIVGHGSCGKGFRTSSRSISFRCAWPRVGVALWVLEKKCRSVVALLYVSLWDAQQRWSGNGDTRKTAAWEA